LVGEGPRPTSTAQSGAVVSSTEAAASAPSSAKALRAEEFRRELQILEPARRAFARGDFAAVIRAADEHQRTFPFGGLAEERDAMRARALFRQGRRADARLAAAAFRGNFPNSAVLGDIEK
jgi:outer membrane protein assembly factor BamD (BamD/ComL family)